MPMRRAVSIAIVALALALPVRAQMTFEQALRDLTSTDAGMRRRAAQMLKEAAYPEAAVPLAALVTDPDDDVQLQAIAGEINIFRAENDAPDLPKQNRPLTAKLSRASDGPTLTLPAPVLDEFMAQWEESNQRVARELVPAAVPERPVDLAAVVVVAAERARALPRPRKSASPRRASRGCCSRTRRVPTTSCCQASWWAARTCPAGPCSSTSRWARATR